MNAYTNKEYLKEQFLDLIEYRKAIKNMNPNRNPFQTIKSNITYIRRQLKSNPPRTFLENMKQLTLEQGRYYFNHYGRAKVQLGTKTNLDVGIQGRYDVYHITLTIGWYKKCYESGLIELVKMKRNDRLMKVERVPDQEHETWLFHCMRQQEYGKNPIMVQYYVMREKTFDGTYITSYGNSLRGVKTGNTKRVKNKVLSKLEI